MKTTLCFGELMARFSPPGHLRLGQALPGSLEVTFAGAEANVAVAIAQLGGRAEFISALPRNPLGATGLAAVRAAGVGVDGVLQREAGRCGLYFVEAGAGPRGGLVLYDRADSTFALTAADAYPWDRYFDGAGWFHTTGISPAVSRLAAGATLAGVQAARAAGLTVSCDLNFRRKLWTWEPGTPPETLARRTLQELLVEVDVLVGNASDIALAIGEDGQAGAADPEACAALARRAGQRFPRLRWVALTLRQNHSASRNRWGGLLVRTADGAAFLAPQAAGAYAPYEIDTIVDRVGTGDVFTGALIYALQTPELAEPARAVAFATAAGCLAHTTAGDFFRGTRAEVEALMHGDGAGFLAR